VALSTEQLRQRGAAVDSVLCVIDRSGGAHPALDTIGLSVTALFTAEELGS
jgi:orotate phosphoribosyltransferase